MPISLEQWYAWIRAIVSPSSSQEVSAFSVESGSRQAYTEPLPDLGDPLAPGDPLGGGGHTSDGDPAPVIDTSEGSLVQAGGEEVCLDVTTNAAGDPLQFWFGVQDTQNTYFVKLNPASDTFSISRLQSGVTTLLAATSVTLAGSTTYHLHITWLADGTMSVVIEDDGGTPLDTLATSDSTWTYGGVGYQATDAGISWSNVQVCAAGPQSLVIDDFEDGDLVEYGGNADASISTTVTHDGSASALQIDNVGGTEQYAASMSGLENYPSAGDSFEHWFRLTDSGDAPRMRYATQDANSSADRYQWCYVGPSSNQIRVERFNAGSYSNLSSAAAPTLSTGVWYRGVVEWANDGTLTHRVFDSDGTTELASTSAVDTSYTSGGIGFTAGHYNGNTTTNYWDDARITDAPTVIEDFEDADVSNYEYNDGFTTAADSPEGGTTVGYCPNLGSGPNNRIMYTLSNLPTFPAPGDTFEFLVRSNGSAANNVPAAGLLFGVQDNQNFYQVQSKPGNLSGTGLKIRRYAGGSFTDIAYHNVDTITHGVWYRCIVDWAVDGTISATLETLAGTQIAQTSTNDTTYTSGGLGYLARSGPLSEHRSFFDNVRIIN